MGYIPRHRRRQKRGKSRLLPSARNRILEKLHLGDLDAGDLLVLLLLFMLFRENADEELLIALGLLLIL